MRAIVISNARLIRGEDNRSVHVGEVVEGQDAAELVALGHAEEIVEEAEPSEAPKPSRSQRPAIEQATARPGELR